MRFGSPTKRKKPSRNDGLNCFVVCGGKEAIKKLLEIDPEVKAIVSSGYSDDPVLANFQEYGFKGMMPKPFESHLLSKVLHEVLRGEKD